MKPIINTLLVAAAGILLGSCVTTALLSLKTGAVMEKLYSVSVYDKARTAVALQTGRQQEVVTRLARELVNATVTLGPSPHSEFGRNALWMIRTFFEVSREPAPEKARAILQALPFEPPQICRTERQRIFATRPVLQEGK